MKILNVSQCDWANYQYDNMKALRSVGIECDSVVMQAHPFYDEQNELMKDVVELYDRMQDYDVIQFFHDNISLYNTILGAFGNKKIIAYHTSSVYRQSHAYINQSTRLHVRHHVCAMPEFMAMCPGAVYMVGAVDTDAIAPNPYNLKVTMNEEGNQLHVTGKAYPPSPIKFAHYPSNSTVKGSEKIYQMMQELDINFSYASYTVPYEEQIKRMQACDVYIEMFTRKDGNGNPYGNFGVTALEAAAMGKVVITNCRDWHVYSDAYGKLPFVVANDESEFRKQATLFNVSPHLVKQVGEETRKAIVRNHSYKATGEYFLKHVL